MARHQLIDAYLAALVGRLPADTVDELADGLIESYQRHLAGGLDPETAARGAIADFGAADRVVAAFVRQAAGRRLAWVLLGSGPLVGACWAATLLVGHAWSWPIPAGVRVAFAVGLLTVIAGLWWAATSQRDYRRTRVTLAAGIGLITLDGALLATVAFGLAPIVWPMAVAIPASLARMAVTARAMPSLLRH